MKIGNLRGILSSKALIKETGLCKEVEIRVEKNALIGQPVARAWTGWDAAFQKMADVGDEILLDGEVHTPTSWEEAEWAWS